MLKNKRNIWGLVLSGGMSKRMGQDKALIEIDGNTQLNKTYTLLQNHLPEVFVSSRACLLYTSPSPRDGLLSRTPSSA